MIGYDQVHHAVRGRVFFQRAAAIASTHGISAAQPIQRVEAAAIPSPPTRPTPRPGQEQRGSGVQRVVARAPYLPKCSASISPIGQWIYTAPSEQTPAPLQGQIANATDMLNNTAMAQAAAMTEEDKC